MGAARGLDEGLIGTTASQKSFSKLFGLKNPDLSKEQQADLLSNITSMVQMGSILGALVAFYLTDKIGRLWATRQLCIIWVTGISIFLASAAHGNIGLVSACRRYRPGPECEYMLTSSVSFRRYTLVVS